MNPLARRMPIGYGVAWFGRGWRGFANSPGLLIGVMFLWLVVVVGLNLVPLIGSLASTIIGPALFGGYLLMCRAAINDDRPALEQFFAGLTRRECRVDSLVLGLMLLLGHVAAMLITFAAFVFFSLVILGEVPLDKLAEYEATGSVEGMVVSMGLVLALILTILVGLIPYTILAMAMTYAAPLVVDNRCTALTALRVSFNACLRNILPLSVFALVYLALAVIALIPLGLGLILFVPVSMAALAVSYMDIFGDGER